MNFFQNVVVVKMLLVKTCMTVYSGVEFPKRDFQFNYDIVCYIYVAILHHSGLSYNMF